MLFNFHKSIDFPVFLLLLISNFIPLCLEKIWCGMISIFLNLLRLSLWADIWSILENVPHALKNVYALVLGTMFCRCLLDLVDLRSPFPYFSSVWLLYPLLRANTEVSNYYYRTISPISSVNFCFFYFVDLSLGM